MSVSYSVSQQLGEKSEHPPVEIVLEKPTGKSQAHKKVWILASIVLIGEVFCAVLEAQLTAVGFKLPAAGDPYGNGSTTVKESRFHAPYFYTLCRFFSRSLAFPILFLGMWLFSRLLTGQKFQSKEFFRHCSKVVGPGPAGITVIGFIKLFALPTLSSMGTGIGYIVALAFIPASITSACFCAVVAFSYVLSIFVLKHPHLIIKTIFVLLSFGGVAMVGYETTQDPLAPDAYIGIIAIVASCICLALHQLFYSKSFPNADLFQSAFVVTVMFGVSFLLFWPVPLATKLLGVEVWLWSDVPWGYVIGGITSSLVGAFLYAYGLTRFSPFFMSLGELLNLTAAGLVDHFVQGVAIGPYQISGFSMIGLAFFVLLLPDRMLSIGYIKERLGMGRQRLTSNRIHPSESKKNLVSVGQSSASLATLS